MKTLINKWRSPHDNEAAVLLLHSDDAGHRGRRRAKLQGGKDGTLERIAQVGGTTRRQGESSTRWTMEKRHRNNKTQTSGAHSQHMQIARTRE